MAMSYSRSFMLCPAARLGIADALGDEVCSVARLACQADVDALYPLACPSQHRHYGGNDAETFSADSVWKAAAKGTGPVGMASRRFLGGSGAWTLLSLNSDPVPRAPDPTVPSDANAQSWTAQPLFLRKRGSGSRVSLSPVPKPAFATQAWALTGRSCGNILQSSARTCSPCACARCL